MKSGTNFHLAINFTNLQNQAKTHSMYPKEQEVLPRLHQFFDTLTLFQSGGQILPTIAEMAPTNYPCIHHCTGPNN